MWFNVFCSETCLPLKTMFTGVFKVILSQIDFIYILIVWQRACVIETLHILWKSIKKMLYLWSFGVPTFHSFFHSFTVHIIWENMKICVAIPIVHWPKFLFYHIITCNKTDVVLADPLQPKTHNLVCHLASVICRKQLYHVLYTYRLTKVWHLHRQWTLSAPAVYLYPHVRLPVTNENEERTQIDKHIKTPKQHAS